MSVTAKKVLHPYIVTNKKIRNGDPVIAGTGIRVLDVAVRYELMGMSPEDILVALPHVNLSQIHDALSYYYEHKQEMDKSWKDAIKKAADIKKTTPSLLEKKLGKVKDLHR